MDTTGNVTKREGKGLGGGETLTLADLMALGLAGGKGDAASDIGMLRRSLRPA